MDSLQQWVLLLGWGTKNWTQDLEHTRQTFLIALIPVLYFFLFLFFSVGEFRALHLLGKHSVSRAACPVLVSFSGQTGLEFGILLPQSTGFTGVHYYACFFHNLKKNGSHKQCHSKTPFYANNCSHFLLFSWDKLLRHDIAGSKTSEAREEGLCCLFPDEK